jgi:hypothetical protein
LKDVPKEESLWDGECYVFDRRVSVTHNLEHGARNPTEIYTEVVIGSHACSLEANMRVTTNGIPRDFLAFLPVDTVNCVATLKARQFSNLPSMRSGVGAG